MADRDADYMRLALSEAGKGFGKTSPNPCVGAVVVRNGKVVGKGWHKKAGTPHAEVNALAAAGNKAKGATIYVTLEPCNHTGRTPPCTEAILAAGVTRVVVGMDDPNPGVAGGGNDFLRARGLDVSCGLLEDECRAINHPFIKHVTTGLPWLIMKAGMSLDGRIAVPSGACAWITNEASRRYVHRLRHQVDAILVGVGTALADDPSLTTRLPDSAGKTGRDPVRIVLDSRLQLSPDAKMLTGKSPAATMVFCAEGADHTRRRRLEEAGAVVRQVRTDSEGLVLKDVLVELGKVPLLSVLVEGGSAIHSAFLRAGLYDQANLFIAPVLLGGDGVPLINGMGFKTVGEAPRLKDVRTRRFGPDIMVEGFFA